MFAEATGDAQRPALQGWTSQAAEDWAASRRHRPSMSKAVSASQPAWLVLPALQPPSSAPSVLPVPFTSITSDGSSAPGW